MALGACLAPVLACGQSLPSPLVATPSQPGQAAPKGYVDTAVAAVASALAPVATTGSYASLTGRPALAPVATSGAYSDLTGAPGAYSLPVASLSVLGGVKIDGVTVTIAGGTLSVPTDTSRYAASNPAGYITASQAPVQSVAGLTGAPNAAQLSGALAGTAAGTLAAGNDSRILAAQTAAQVGSAIAAGTAANVSGTVALANGGTGATTAAAARTNFGLGGAATLNVGTVTGTVADAGVVATQGTQIAARLVAASNLSDLAAPATARTNLGLGGAAILGVGTASGTVAAGDDSRITGALSAATAAATYLPLAGGSLTGLVNVGTASANYVRLFGAPTGSGPGVSAQGSDANVSLVLTAKGAGTIYAASPLTLTTALSVTNGGTGGTTQATARTGLGLGGAAVLGVGTVAGTVAAGDDSRITGAQTAAQVASAVSSGTAANVSGVVALANGGTGGTSASTARTNLGLGGAAVLGVGTASGTVAAGDDSRITGALSASTAATTYAPLASPTFTGAVKVGTAGFIADASQPVQINAATGSQAFYAANKNGAYGLLLGYDASANTAVVRNVSGTDPIDVLVNSTTRAARFTAAGRTLIGTATDDGVNRLQVNGSAAFSTPLGIASGGTGQTTAAAALSALGGAPFNNPNLTGIVTVGTGTFLSDTLVPVQLNATAALPAFYGVNKAGAYGLLFGYDPTIPAGVIRNVTADPLNFVVNNTVQALSMTADGNARFLGIATAATLRVGTTAGPTWTTGTGAPTSTQPVGSTYSRTDGALGSTFYVSRGGGTWNPAAGL